MDAQRELHAMKRHFNAAFRGRQMFKHTAIRKFQGATFTVAVHAEMSCGYRIRVGRNAHATTPHDDVYTSQQAFELSRLLRLGASFVEWVEDYGTEAADEWPGKSGAAGGGQSS